MTNFDINLKDSDNIGRLRRFLKTSINNLRIINDNQREQVYNIVNRTIGEGESNTVILVGPRGSGKKILINSVLECLDGDLIKEALLVKLNGLIHTDDRLSLKSITKQMCLENCVDGKIFGSFADNLSFLLGCLKSGNDNNSKTVVFILEEFDLFCQHHNQTLLYNLFDVAQSSQAPICVIGITSRLDFIELLEKRVKSRFSHRQIFTFHGLDGELDFENRLKIIENLLMINDHIDIDERFKKDWNNYIKILMRNKSFINHIRRLFDLDLSQKTLKNLLFMTVSQLTHENYKNFEKLFSEQLDGFETDDLLQTLHDLSVLELCLIIAMKHHVEIYDNQPMNFAMIFSRYTKFINSTSCVQTVEKAVVMKAFEHLQNLELISMVGTKNSGIQKEYQMFKLLILPQQINETVQNYQGLPTEVMQWNNFSTLV